MSRYLFVVPPLVGHINPTLAVAEQLEKRGHEVAWAGHEDGLGLLLPAGSQVFRATDDDLNAELQTLRTTWQGLTGVAALRFFWQKFVVPVGHAMIPGVDLAIATFRPDVVISDQQAIAGPVAAARAGLPWVTSATTSAEVARCLQRDLPKVEEWVTHVLADFCRDAGMERPVDLRFSDLLVLCFTTTELIGPDLTFPDHYVFTGPAMTSRPPSGDFPWDRLDDDRRRVLVSLGSLNAEAGKRFFGIAAEALGDLVQLIMVAPDGTVDEPAGSIVSEWVPQLELLPHLDAVVSHAGHNTVVEALAHGLPQVVAPIRDDQPIVAQQVEAAGAAIRVRFARLRAHELRDAVGTVLDDPSFRIAAERIQRSFVAAGGAVTAADHLDRLVA